MTSRTDRPADPRPPRAPARSARCALTRALWIGLVALATAGPAAADPHTLADFPTDEAYLRYIGNLPKDFNSDWVVDYNGVTHDDTHWYFAGKNSLYRVPLSQKLNVDFRGLGTVQRVRAADLPALDGANHFGDITYFRHDGKGYVLVPADGRSGAKLPLLAIFRADASLSLVAVMEMPGLLNRSGKGQAAFAEIDAQGRVYSAGSPYCSSCPGGGECACVRRYTLGLGWNAVGAAPVASHSLTFEHEIPMHDADGSRILLKNFQGAAFAPSQRVLYVTNGYDCSTTEPGLHAFELRTQANGTQSLHRLARSGERPDSLFRFEYICTLAQQEPQGLTVWDLDDVPNHHGIRGQLHVMMLQNPIDQGYLGGDDRGFFKHYTGKLFVDPARSSGNGRIGTPYGSIAESLVERSCTWAGISPPWPPPPPCVDRPAPWSGSMIVLAPGQYSHPVDDPKLVGHAITVRGNGTAEFGN